MQNDNNLTNYEKAHIDYLAGMKYKDIASKYGVSENTVKSWRQRYGWKRENAQKKVCKVASMQELGNNLPSEVKIRANSIKEDLLKQLEEKGIYEEHYRDMVNRYIKFYFVAIYLEEDIETRGVSLQWSNGGKQQGVKKNDSITEMTKVSAEMRSILTDLGLNKPAPKVDDDDDI